MTVLRGIAPEDYEILGRVLTQAILPEGWACCDPRHMASLPKRVTLAHPRAQDGPRAPRHLQQLRDLVSAGLTHAQPLWIVLPEAADLPEPLLAAHCTELRLPAPDPDLLIAFLRASHSRTGRIGEAATRAALPPAEQLREMRASISAGCRPRRTGPCCTASRSTKCGHAIVAASFGAPVARIAITCEGGFTERSNPPREGLAEDFEQELAVYMAGRAAERLVLGSISAGAGGSAQSDIAMATKIALDFDRNMGLGVHGHAWLGAADPARLSQDERARVITRLNAAEDRAMEILEAHRLLLDEMASDLIKHRDLSGADAKVWLANAAPANELNPE